MSFRGTGRQWPSAGSGYATGPPTRRRGALCTRKSFSSLDDLRHAAGADRTTTLADGELEAVLHGDRLLEVDRHVGVVTRHDHVLALGELDLAGDVSRPEVELRRVVREERLVTATLLLGQDVDVALEVRVGSRGARLDDDHAALHILLLGATEQEADVLARTTLVEDLAEHLDTGHCGGLLRGTDADDVDGLAGLDDAALDTTGDDGATTSDREAVSYTHLRAHET